MPLKNITSSRPPEAEQLLAALVAEWREPKETGQPVILLEEKSPGGSVHVIVVWDQWGELTQQERSEVVMDACEEVQGADTALAVTVAMGLTPTEADRMHISYR